MDEREHALRAVDVRGQWLDLGRNERPSGIMHGGKRWADGLTWDMIDADLVAFEKVISKTERSMTEPYRFELTPIVHEMLAQVPQDRRVGPAIVRGSTGRPWRVDAWSKEWARHRTAAGVPENVWMLDVRAGAIIDAKSRGADLWTLRDFGQHADVSTTSRYARDRSASVAKVVELRGRKEG